MDGVRPLLQAAVVNGPRLTLTYDETLDETSTSPARAFAFRGGSAVRAVSGVAVRGRNVTLTLNPAVLAGEENLTLNYAPAQRAVRDATGNAAAAFSDQAVRNETPAPVYDTDRDGLIEIASLAQLDAVRYDLDGDGVPTFAGAAAHAAAFPNGGVRLRCGALSGCGGYELVEDLDFDTNGGGGAGWQPIGFDINAVFGTTFEGNGHRIRGLVIGGNNSPAGLFGYSDRSAVVRRVGLLEVEVTGNHGVGALVGGNYGIVAASYATGRVAGIGRVGGLVGTNYGSIRASYASVRVSGQNAVGGLAGDNDLLGAITGSYATGRVSGRDSIGGLVGPTPRPSPQLCHGAGSWHYQRRRVGRATHQRRRDHGQLLGHDDVEPDARWAPGPDDGAVAGAHRLQRHLCGVEPGPRRRPRR